MRQMLVGPRVTQRLTWLIHLAVPSELHRWHETRGPRTPFTRSVDVHRVGDDGLELRHALREVGERRGQGSGHSGHEQVAGLRGSRRGRSAARDRYRGQSMSRLRSALVWGAGDA